MGNPVDIVDVCGTPKHPVKDVDAGMPDGKPQWGEQHLSGRNSGLHPVYQTTYHRRMRYEGERCRHCLGYKASIDTRFQSAFPFCERCGKPWVDPFRDNEPENVIAAWDEEYLGK